MNGSDSTEYFVQQIAENQNRMLAYIYSMLGDHSRAADVLQETNLVLWRKKEEYQASRPFLPWALAISRFQVLAHVRDQSRDRCLLDSELVELLSAESESECEGFESLRQALRTCMKELSPKNHDLIRRRYFLADSIAGLAKKTDRGESAVKVALLRIRRKLAECIDQRISVEAGQ